MDFKILSRREVETFKTREKHIIISIYDPESKPVTIYSDNPPEGILYMKFPDMDKEVKGYAFNYLLFDNYNAKDILRFVNQYKDEVDLIVVNCEAGVSRSAGVAGALARILNGDDSYIFKHFLPNSLVYSTIIKEYYNELEQKYN